MRGEDFGARENYETTPIILNDNDGSQISIEMTGVSFLFSRGGKLLATRDMRRRFGHGLRGLQRGMILLEGLL